MICELPVILPAEAQQSRALCASAWERPFPFPPSRVLLRDEFQELGVTIDEAKAVTLPWCRRPGERELMFEDGLAHCCPASTKLVGTLHPVTWQPYCPALSLSHDRVGSHFSSCLLQAPHSRCCRPGPRLAGHGAGQGCRRQRVEREHVCPRALHAFVFHATWGVRVLPGHLEISGDGAFPMPAPTGDVLRTDS